MRDGKNPFKTLDLRDCSPFGAKGALFPAPSSGPQSVVEAVLRALGTPVESCPQEAAMGRWIEPEPMLTDGTVEIDAWVAAPELALIARFE